MEIKNKKRLITPALKKKYKKDWNSCFANFYPEKYFLISRRVGPLIISIGFDVGRHREYYKLDFSVENLSEPSDVRTCCLLDSLRSERTNGIDFITVLGHESGKYITAAERMKSQYPFLNESPISLNQIIQAYKDYCQVHPNANRLHYSDPALIAAWAGKLDLAQELLEWGYNIFKNKPEGAHERVGGLDTWYKSIQEKISNPDRLREIVEEQAVFHKVDHIPVEDMIIDV